LDDFRAYVKQIAAQQVSAPGRASQGTKHSYSLGRRPALHQQAPAGQVHECAACMCMRQARPSGSCSGRLLLRRAPCTRITLQRWPTTPQRGDSERSAGSEDECTGCSERQRNRSLFPSAAGVQQVCKRVIRASLLGTHECAVRDQGFREAGGVCTPGCCAGTMPGTPGSCPWTPASARPPSAHGSAPQTRLQSTPRP